MKRIKYTGPFDAVDVPDAGLEGVAPGDVVEVDDKVAGRVPSVEVVDGVEVNDPGEGLLAQVDNWCPAPAGKIKREG